MAKAKTPKDNKINFNTWELIIDNKDAHKSKVLYGGEMVGYVTSVQMSLAANDPVPKVTFTVPMMFTKISIKDRE